MKKLLLLLLTFQCTVFSSFAQMGTVDTSHSITSKILKREMSYSVYLPPGYNESNRSYPVLYLLHGMTGDHTDWVIKGEVGHIADNAIDHGGAPPMIIIMPDGLYDTFYINNYDGSIRWEDFFHEEFIPQVEQKFRIKQDRNTRAISGLSMGGYGSLYHAIKYKDMFKYCYAMSAAVIEREPVKEGQELSDFEKNFNLKTWGPMNKEGLPENYKEHSVQEMVKAMDAYKNASAQFPMPPKPDLPYIFIDCGDDDFLLKPNTNLVNLMKEKKIPFEFRVRDGGHTWEYWRTALKMALTEVGNAFRN